MTTSITFRMIDFKMFLPFDNGLTDGLTNGHTLVVVKSLSRLKTENTLTIRKLILTRTEKAKHKRKETKARIRITNLQEFKKE